MVQKVKVIQVSDLSGAEADETVRFGIDKSDYEIDLSGSEAGEIRGIFAPYIACARKKGRVPRRRGSRRASREDMPEIREYARARGYDIKERGAVPQRIVDEYDLMKDYSSAKR